MNLLRVVQFNNLEMTHVCCQRRTSSPGQLEEEEIDEILSEERLFRLELEDKMRDFTVTDDIYLETWLRLLNGFYACREEVKETQWTWGVWSREEDNESYQSEAPPPWRLSSKSQSSTDVPLADSVTLHPHYYIEAGCDEFREEQGPNPVPMIPLSQLYSAWVDYSFEHRDEYSHPSYIDVHWYNRRKYWASRQADALENAPTCTQTSSEADINI
jgi:hypothetical protein